MYKIFVLLYLLTLHLSWSQNTLSNNTSCSSNCANCSSDTPSLCLQCTDGYGLISENNCLQCTEGCSACDRGLATNSTICSTCFSNYTFIPELYICNLTTQITENCIPQCKTCVNNTCVVCEQGSWLDQNSTCQLCQAPCMDCNDANHCQNCIDGYFINPGGQECLACPQNCASCVSFSDSEKADQCLTCLNGWSLDKSGEMCTVQSTDGEIAP